MPACPVVHYLAIGFISQTGLSADEGQRYIDRVTIELTPDWLGQRIRLKRVEMDANSITQIIETAIRNLFDNQPDIFNLTASSSQTEWNLGSHLANEIHALLPAFAYDLDLKKPDAGDKRPDIVFHERGTHEQNFLASR